jgi:hypothetical protein
MHVPKLAFFITKHFGSGVIITTAFIHVSVFLKFGLCSSKTATYNLQFTTHEANNI